MYIILYVLCVCVYTSMHACVEDMIVYQSEQGWMSLTLHITKDEYNKCAI